MNFNFCRLLLPTSVQQTSRAFAGRWYDQPTQRQSEQGLQRKDAHAIYAPRRGDGAVFKLVPGANGELRAGYTLFAAAIQRAELSWHPYNGLTKAEKDVYVAHLKAVEARLLEYSDPHDARTHQTVSALLYASNCCGSGCRHCPYELDKCDEATRKSRVYNGVYYV